MLELLAATKNAGKIKELKASLSNLHIRFRDLSEFPNVIEVEETGADFAENAVLKAQFYALQTRMWALADDSGLEVKALDGAPGIFSARYAGENSTDGEKIAKLLQELNQIQEERCARFVCTIAISNEKGEIKFLANGVCAGKIALTPSGTNGFGYDPIFIPDGFEQTFGELSSKIKQKISHRAQAIKKINRYLRDFTVSSLDQTAFRL
ncbi:MAG: XTP/dITP diphosphatase [Acidobacteria bacterium]|nr:XTP/dITP diphosphatase [Acidobacteriota bacterium]